MGGQVIGMHHVTLRVSDLATSREFYEGVLGLEVDQEFDDKIRLRLGSGPTASRLVLRPFLEGTPLGDRFDERRAGLDHIAMAASSVEDLDRVTRRLRDAQVNTRGRQPVPGGGWIVTFRDPDNIQLEFFADG